MSVQASAWVIQHSKHKGSDLLCLMMIANHAHSDGTNAFPSIDTLATECRMSGRQIKRIVQNLEASGELLVERSHGRVSHTFTVVMGTPNGDKLSRPTVTDCPKRASAAKPNGDKSGTPTVTNPTANGDKSDILFSYIEPSLEPSSEPKEGQAPPPAVKEQSLQTAGLKPRKAVHVAANPPTLQEIQEWCVRHGHDTRYALSFLSYYGANNWMQNNNKPVYSWPHALAGWIEREPKFAPPRASPAGSMPVPVTDPYAHLRNKDNAPQEPPKTEARAASR